jgi:subfamily B ATP-binding cassette protein MsbA
MAEFAPFRARLRPYRPRLAVLGAVLLGSGLAEGLGIGLFYPLIEYAEHGDAFLARESVRPLVTFLHALGLEPSVGIFVGLIFLVVLATLVLKRAQAELSSRIYNPFMRDLRVEAFGRVLSSHLFYFTTGSTARLVQIFEDEIEYAGQALNFLVTGGAAVLSLAVYGVVALVISWKLTVVVAALGALRWFVVGMMIKRTRSLGEEHGLLHTRLKSQVGAVQQGIDVVKTSGAEEREAARFGTLAEAVRVNAESLVSAQSRGAFAEGLLGDGLLCVIIWLAVSRLAVSGATLLTFLFVVSRIVPKISGVNDARIRIAEYLSRIHLLPRVLADDGLPALPWGSETKTSFERELALTGVSFRYPEAADEALAGMDLIVRKGETVALVGESGSGKTTLARLVLRLFDPTAGTVTVDGVPLPRLRREDWTKLVSVVGQDAFVFDDTLEANVRYGAPDRGPEALREALRRARCDEFVARLPDGLNTRVGERGVMLSGGQRQRVAIARAFLRDSPILVLDEATSAMDSVTEGLIQEALRELAKDRTLLVIAHRLSTVRDANRIAVLDKGRLAEIGTHAELFAKGGLYRRYHDLQAL